MNDLYEYYWTRYIRLLRNDTVPDHLVASAYKVFITLHQQKYKLFLASSGYKSVFTE